ncbi:Uu.00g017670.m01.CDS01 [Anthostomella pinea]|uniref:Uu.00g017670.m01.CDS01 n=1 Tax=Anthostomella pinea TaxID=933095 RepID=A0AAI8W060_9PEZI|nr:Uu.00g017670.m01.CDS01 [Anthostomella pinea]
MPPPGIFLGTAGNVADDVVVLDSGDVADFNRADILPQPDSQLRNIRAWLQPTEYAHRDGEYMKHMSSHLNGTARWVLDAPIFRQWHDSQQDGILWIRGIPGSGKSVLAASLIKHLTLEDCPVLYFFFRHTLDTNHSPEAAFLDWVAQILINSSPLQLELTNSMQVQHSATVPVQGLTLDELCRLLRLALTHIPKAYGVVDALDEMDQNRLEPFLRCLDELGQGHLKLIITSRPIAMVERVMRGIKVLDVRLRKNLIEPDMTAYMCYRLNLTQTPKAAFSSIIQGISSKADGLFLYAKLAMDAIADLPRAADMQQALQLMPASLTQMYTDLLEEHAAHRYS